MNPDTYQQAALRTESHPDSFNRRRIRLTHALFGMMGEIGELAEAIEKRDPVNIMEEVGDFLWYFAIGLDSQGKRLSHVEVQPYMVKAYPYSSTNFIHDLTIIYGNYVDAWKGLIYYERIPDRDVVLSLERQILLHLRVVLARFDITYEQCLAKNIAKLQARFPEKFEHHRARNRDLKAEREVLEGR